MNARYHSAGEAFLDSVHRWLMFSVIIAGAGALSQLMDVVIAPEWLPSVFAAGATAFGALDLSFDLSNRAKAHALMKRRYFELLVDLTEGRKSLIEAEACAHRYCADEEPAYQVLLLASWNAAMILVMILIMASQMSRIVSYNPLQP